MADTFCKDVVLPTQNVVSQKVKEIIAKFPATFFLFGPSLVTSLDRLCGNIKWNVF